MFLQWCDVVAVRDWHCTNVSFALDALECRDTSLDYRSSYLFRHALRVPLRLTSFHSRRDGLGWYQPQESVPRPCPAKCCRVCPFFNRYVKSDSLVKFTPVLIAPELVLLAVGLTTAHSSHKVPPVVLEVTDFQEIPSLETQLQK